VRQLRRWIESRRRRLLLIAVMGFILAAVILSSPQPIVGDLIESLVFLVFGVLAVVGLLGHGPLRVKPNAVLSEVDQLVHLGELWRSGEISRDELEVQKRRVIGR
jgi:hypothetical protein